MACYTTLVLYSWFCTVEVVISINLVLKGGKKVKLTTSGNQSNGFDQESLQLCHFPQVKKET